MQCTKCGTALDPNAVGFIVCPLCHTVNIGNTPEEVAAAAVPLKTPRHLSMRVKLIIAAAVSLVVLIGAGYGVLSYQNGRANFLLAAAKTAIGKQGYDTAAGLLKQADGYYSFGGTKQQIAVLSAKDKTWLADNDELNQATALNQKGKYDDAAALLKKIDKSFPGYKKVTALQTQINLAKAKATIAAEATATGKQTSVTSKPASAGVTTASGKRFTSVAAASSLASAKNIAQAQQALQSFASQYGLNMEISSVSPSSYVSSYDTYTTLTDADLTSLRTYGALFIDEWAKYPTDWIASSKLKDVVLVKDLAVSGTHRAAAPDPFGEAMYYDVTFSGDYAREVVHHEFDHLITYNDFGSYTPVDSTWTSYNPAGFTYGNGGASCYLPNNTCLTGQHPIAGFVTGYAASAIEEDKAELYAYLMTDDYYKQLKGWVTTDSNLAGKVNDYKQFIASHSPEMSGSYFDDVNP